MVSNKLLYGRGVNFPFCSQSTQVVSQVAPPEPAPGAQPQPAQPAAVVSSIDRYVKGSSPFLAGGWNRREVEV